MTKAHASRSLLLAATWSLMSYAHAQPSSGYIRYDPSKKEVIVFVHGVVGDSRDTWTNAQTGSYWPALVRDDSTFSDANVWVFGYSSPKVEKAQNIEELARKLGDELRAQDVFESHQRVYFLVHSMGGLVTREMLTQQLPSPDKVPLIYFYGTPSAGADLAGVAAALSENPQFANMRPFTRESDVATFSNRWLSTGENPNARYPQRIWSFCAYEIESLVGGKVIVSSASASFLCNTAPRGALANHITMVKPADKTREPYKYFVSAYKFTRSEEGRFLAAVDALTLHSAAAPGLRIESLKLRSKKLSDDPIVVGCDEVAAGQKQFRVALAPTERLIAVRPAFQAAKHIQARTISSTFDREGSVTVGYQIQGSPAQPFGKCSKDGRAKVEIQYLIEESAR